MVPPFQRGPASLERFKVHHGVTETRRKPRSSEYSLAHPTGLACIATLGNVVYTTTIIGGKRFRSVLSSPLISVPP